VFSSEIKLAPIKLRAGLLENAVLVTELLQFCIILIHGSGVVPAIHKIMPVSQPVEIWTEQGFSGCVE